MLIGYLYIAEVDYVSVCWNYREDEYLVNMQHTVIPSWYQREGYVKSMATLIQKELQAFEKPQKVDNKSLCFVFWI